MSFLRALRAYIGLGPDEEIEDRYLSELNARRRELALDEIGPSARSRGSSGAQRRPRREAPAEAEAGYDLDEHLGQHDQGIGIDELGLDDPDGDVVVRPRRRAAVGGGIRAFGAALAPSDLPEADIDLTVLDGDDGATRPGRHDIEPDAALETLADDGEGVRLRARAGAITTGETTPAPDRHADEEVAVVRSLDSMRAKPRTLMPESFADAKLVADEFKRDIPVVLNLQAVDRDLARRLIDFASGICYVLDGSMEKIASQVFLLIPESVEVSDEDRRRIEERGYAR